MAYLFYSTFFPPKGMCNSYINLAYRDYLSPFLFRGVFLLTRLLTWNHVAGLLPCELILIGFMIGEDPTLSFVIRRDIIG